MFFDLMFAYILAAINLNPLLTLIILVALVFLAWNLTLHWQVWQTRKKIALMFQGTKASDLEGVIYEQIKRLRQTEKNVTELEKFAKNIEAMALKSIQKVGVLRFNPFKDTGGDQSFCISCLDAENTGFTLTSLYTREGTMIYTKPVISGESKYPLTEEEREAIGKAINSNSKRKIQKSKPQLKSQN